MTERDPVPGGILLVNKPAGITSFLVVSKVRRLYGLRRVGHCGTLDPFADGLLPIVVGRATRAVAYMDAYDKTYQVRIRFGRETDTMDHTGSTTAERPLDADTLNRLAGEDFAPVRAAIRDLTAIRELLPPLYSAIKVDGQPLYAYARSGQAVERRSRPVTVYAAETLAVVRDAAGLYADARIHCAKGTYIRSLAEEVGRATGLLAHAEALTRLQTGPFTLAEAYSWEAITAALDARAPLPLLPVERAFARFDRMSLDAGQTRRMLQGQLITLPPEASEGAAAFQETAAAPDDSSATAETAAPADSSATAEAAAAADSSATAEAAAAPMEARLVTVFGPAGFAGLGRVTATEGGQRLLAAERMFADLEDYRE